MTTVAVTCIQLLRDLASFRHLLESEGITVRAADIPGQYLEGRWLVEAVTGCAGVIAGDDRFTAEVLDKLPELRVISKWGIGVDGIDLKAAARREILVTNTPGVFDDEVADVAMAYVTMLARKLILIDRGVRAGNWPKPAGTSLRGLRLGIIGLGGIGQALARRALVAGMAVTGVDPFLTNAASAAALGVHVTSFDQMLPDVDVISVNCPLNDSTFHLFDERAFARVRPGVLLVNTGRGAVISTEALVDALECGVVSGAALDVMEDEPLPAASSLRSFEAVIFGSHNASNTLEASARTHELAIANVIRGLGS